MTAEMLNINAEICRMFSVMFYNPKESFLTEPSTIGELSELLKTLNKDLNFDAEKLIKDTLLTDETELLLDYAALFIGPYQLQAPPYGSVYLDKAKRLNDESTAAVTDIYRQFGLDVESSMNEPADHIAIELEFIHTALIMIDNKKAAGEDTSCDEQVLTDFIANYFKPFATQMSALMVKNASTNFYKTIGKLLSQYSQSL